MKKVSLLLSLSVLSLAVITGCLKDKGFEDQKYGIQVRDIKAVGLAQASRSPVIVGITGSPNPVTIAGPLVTIEGTTPATGDINVKLATNDAAVTAAGLTLLPAGSYTVSTLSPVIKKDSSTIGNLTITINNSNTLDPNKKYGIGFKIASVDQGYQIAKNMQDVVIQINIKNKYDGIWRLRAYANLGANTSAPHLVQTDCAYELTLETTGPNTVRMSNQPLWRGGAFYDGFCNVNFDFTFNVTTDKITNVTSWATSACGGGGIAVNYPAPGTPVYDSRYKTNGVDRTQDTIFVKMGLNNNPAWIVIDTLIYCGPR